MLRGLYILPTLCTCGNLVAGFASIIYSINNDYSAAAWCIFVAMAMDIMDGQVARWTKSTSAFGIEFDSLADLVSFGIAPSLLMYQVVLHTMHKPGLAIAVFYVVAGALRLARFNAMTKGGQASSSHFVGLPIPAAAGMLASFVLSYELFQDGPEMTVKTIPLIMQRMPFFFKSIPVIMVIISFLMLSSIPYLAVKKLKFNRPKSLQLFTLIVSGIILVLTYPQNTIFILFLLYLISGITGYVWRYVRLRRSLQKTARHRRREDDPGIGEEDLVIETETDGESNG